MDHRLVILNPSRFQRSEVVAALFLEMRESMQYPLMWDRVEENIALVLRRENKGTLPTQEDIAAVMMPINRGGSAAHWMQMCGVAGERLPQWFLRDELGVGTGVNFFDTQRTLKQTNAKRAERHKRQLARLADARKVLSRTVRG
jgi:hypothetical protein